MMSVNRKNSLIVSETRSGARDSVLSGSLNTAEGPIGNPIIPGFELFCFLLNHCNCIYSYLRPDGKVCAEGFVGSSDACTMTVSPCVTGTPVMS